MAAPHICSFLCVFFFLVIHWSCFRWFFLSSRFLLFHIYWFFVLFSLVNAVLIVYAWCQWHMLPQPASCTGIVRSAQSTVLFTTSLVVSSDNTSFYVLAVPPCITCGYCLLTLHFTMTLFLPLFCKDSLFPDDWLNIAPWDAEGLGLCFWLLLTTSPLTRLLSSRCCLFANVLRQKSWVFTE